MHWKIGQDMFEELYFLYYTWEKCFLYSSHCHPHTNSYFSLCALLQICHAAQASCLYPHFSASASGAGQHCWFIQEEPHCPSQPSSTSPASSTSGWPQLGSGPAPVPGPPLGLELSEHPLLPPACGFLAWSVGWRISGQHGQPAPRPPQDLTPHQGWSWGASLWSTEELHRRQRDQLPPAHILSSVLQASPSSQPGVCEGQPGQVQAAA